MQLYPAMTMVPTEHVIIADFMAFVLFSMLNLSPFFLGLIITIIIVNPVTTGVKVHMKANGEIIKPMYNRQQPI